MRGPSVPSGLDEDLGEFGRVRELGLVSAGRPQDPAQRAESLGYESLWVIEHLLTARGLYGTAWLSPLETASFAAGCTTRIHIATGILMSVHRHRKLVQT